MEVEWSLWFNTDVLVLQRCTITSPSAKTIKVSCELLETFERIRVTISSNSCTSFPPITTTGDSPITVSHLTIERYTVEVTAVSSNDLNVEINKIVETITVLESDKSTATAAIKSGMSYSCLHR